MDLSPPVGIEHRIWLIRGQRVMLDSDLAEIYGVPTKRLNEQIRRNTGRFPPDFMFRLTAEEASAMRSQSATASKRNVRFLPYVFTEHGAIMLASVLNSPAAVQASVQVVRAFVRLREMLATHRGLALRLDELERRYDGQFRSVFQAIRQLMASPKRRVRQIGFKPG